MSKQHVVMFVGPDRCGKTNIIAEVERLTGIPSFKATSEHDSFLSSKTTKREAFLNQLRYADPRVFDILKQTGYSLMFDRAHPCDVMPGGCKRPDGGSREVFIREEAHQSGGGGIDALGAQNVTGIAQAGDNVLARHARLILDDVAIRPAIREQADDEIHGQARAPHDGLARQDRGVERDTRG